MAKEANEGQPSMQQKVDEAKKSRETRDNISTTEGFETNNRSDPVKEKYITCLFARKLKMIKPLLMQWKLRMFCSSSLESPGPSKP